jgi:hypothetical protein
MASPLSTLLGGRCTPNRLRWLLAVTLLLLINGLRAEDEFAAAVNRLGEGSFAARTALIEQLSRQNDPRTLALFEALLDGRLQSRSDGKVVIVNGSAEPLSLTDPVDGAALPSVTVGELKKIALNNALRSLLRGKISNLRINSSDHLLRLEAARGLVKNPVAEQLPAIEAAIAREQHQQILSTFKLARGDDHGARGRGAAATGGNPRAAGRARTRGAQPADQPARNRRRQQSEGALGGHPRCGRGGAAAARNRGQVLSDPREPLLRPQPRLGAAAVGGGTGDHLRRDGCHQHGPWRDADAGGLHHLRGAATDAGHDRSVAVGGDSGRLHRHRAVRHRHRARG